MLAITERRLIAGNAAVLFLVLLVFAVAVHVSFTRILHSEVEAGLSQLVDSVIASVDFDLEDQYNAMPDSIVPELPESAYEALNNSKLQWFDAKGVLKAERGRLPLSLPFNKSDVFVEQKKPHAIVLLKPALRHCELLGYVRIGKPLDEVDRAERDLFWGLLLGVIAGGAVSFIGVAWLVRLGMKPVEDTVSKIRQFTADASHELKTPIMAVRTNSSVALKYAEGMREQDKEKFGIILDASNEMSRLTEDLLILARKDDNIGVTSAETTNIAAIIEERLHEWQEEKSAKTIKLTFDKGENLTVNADPDEMRKLFGNLIDNAYQYTPEGGEIRISARNEQSQIVVTIADTGIGIAPEHHGKIFDRFWRVDTSRSRSGSGLGLAIVKAIVDSYRGQISLNSQVGRGSEFKVKFPAAMVSSASVVEN